MRKAGKKFAGKGKYIEIESVSGTAEGDSGVLTF